MDEGLFTRKNAFLWITAGAVCGIWIITLWGSIHTTRARTPSISVIIDDSPAIRLLYVLFVGALAISRTGMVFTSTFYKVDGYGDGVNVYLPYISAVAGAMQLVSFFGVASFSVTLDPVYHYVAAMGTVVFGVLCEGILLYRRLLTGNRLELCFFNFLTLFSTYVCLFTFGGITWANNYNELRSNMAISEWIGYYLIAFINVFRIFDVDKHLLSKSGYFSITDKLSRSL